MNPGAGGSDSGGKTALRRLNKAQHFGIGYTDCHRSRSVSMESIFENAHIGLYEIAGHYDSIAIGNAVNDFIIK